MTGPTRLEVDLGVDVAAVIDEPLSKVRNLVVAVAVGVVSVHPVAAAVAVDVPASEDWETDDGRTPQTSGERQK